MSIPSPDAEKIKDGIAFFQAVKARINKFTGNSIKSDFLIGKFPGTLQTSPPHVNTYHFIMLVAIITTITSLRSDQALIVASSAGVASSFHIRRRIEDVCLGSGLCVTQS